MDSFATCKSCSAPLDTDKKSSATGLCPTCRRTISKAPGSSGSSGLGILDEGSSSRWITVIICGLLMIVPIFLLAKKTPDLDKLFGKEEERGMPESVAPKVSGIGSAMSSTDTILLQGEFKEHTKKLRELRESIGKETANAIDEYNKELAKIGYFDFPNGRRMKTRTDLAATRELLAACREIAQNYRTAETERVKDFPDRVRELNLPPASQEIVLQSFEAAKMEALTLADKFWSAEFRRIKVLEDIVTLLESTYGQWDSKENGEIVMHNESDAASLDALLAAAEQCFTDQDRVRQSHQEKAEEIQARHPSLEVN